MKIKTLTPKDREFPEQLKTIPSPPRQLFVLGDLSKAIEKGSVALVGSRKVSAYGRSITEQIVRELARYKICIVSGLALGVDSVAHREALASKAPTVAVMPCGLDEIYPKSHHQLAKQILASGGALVSEYPEGTPPLKQHFIARNRLVSGLAQAVVVTEAAEKSGTLHTANFALDQGRAVLAVPGNITSDLSRGTNRLIKTGAEPVTEPKDVIFALGINAKEVESQLFGDTDEETLLLALLKEGVHDVHQLQKRSKLEPSAFNQSLTMLEINGKVRPQGSGQWMLC